MTKADLIALADRVMKAEGPDRRIDALVFIALNPAKQTIVGQKPGRFPQEAIYGPITELIAMAEGAERADDAAEYLGAPRYTASVDAALMLVPVYDTEDGPRLPRQAGEPRCRLSVSNSWGKVGHHGSGNELSPASTSPILSDAAR